MESLSVAISRMRLIRLVGLTVLNTSSDLSKSRTETSSFLASCVCPTSECSHNVCGTTPFLTSERYRFNRGMLRPWVPTRSAVLVELLEFVGRYPEVVANRGLNVFPDGLVTS